MAGSVRTVFDSTPANTRRLCFDYIPMWCEHAMQLLCSHDGLEAVAHLVGTSTRRPAARVKRTNRAGDLINARQTTCSEQEGARCLKLASPTNGEEDRRSHWLGCWSSGSFGARASNRLTSIRVQSVHAYRTLFLLSYTRLLVYTVHLSWHRWPDGNR